MNKTMKKTLSLLAGVAVLATTAQVNADVFEKRVSVGAIAGTTGIGAGVSTKTWR
ncbi:hypothetical protein NYA30BAC_01420 [Halomonas sp. NYA30]